MPGFIRRYPADPGDAELLKIEGVVIIDRDPPASPIGALTGLVTIVGEFEDGPFESPVEVLSSGDLSSTFGEFGFTYDGVPSNNPCARSRKADGQLSPEYWNGNGFLALTNKRFSRLAAVRVDTTVGEVSFTRRASIAGNDKFEWDLEPAQTVVLDIGAGSVVATFDAAAAQKDSAAGSYPTTFTGGEKMSIVIDENTPQQIGPLTVAFLATDQTIADVHARINAALGYTAIAVQAGTVSRLTGRVRGTSGNVRIVSQDTIVGTKIGFDTVAAVGTGDVANIDKVTFAEAKSRIEGDIAGTTVERSSDGKLRISANAAATIVATVASTALDFGFTLGTAGSSATGLDGLIPAGTRVRNGSAVEWVTAQTIEVTAANPGPYKVKVRPALDDGTTAGTVAGSVTVVPFPIAIGAFGVSNALPLTAALTEAAIDAKYITALAATLNANAVTKQTSVVISARASNAVRQALRTNAITASEQGLYGRGTVIRPPLKTTRTVAKSATTQPGVGAYRNERVWYAFPGASIFVPQIALRGLGGGAGFTADGFIDVGFDSFVAAVCSRLPPEENPGQLTQYMTGISGLEAGNPDVQNMEIGDYTAFRQSGIAALRIDDGIPIIQSGVTSVDPAVLPQFRNISRRRMADFIQDSLALRMKPFTKKMATKQRRAEAFAECKAFLEGLKSPDQPSLQRIEDYSIDAKSANSPESLAKGIFRIKTRVRLLSSMDVIVLDTTIGEAVNVVDVTLEAA